MRVAVNVYAQDYTYLESKLINIVEILEIRFHVKIAMFTSSALKLIFQTTHEI